MLATLDQLKRRMNVAGGTSEDTLLGELLDAASERVTLLAGRWFEPDPAPPEGGAGSPAPTVRDCRAFGSTFARVPDVRTAVQVLADGRDVTALAMPVRLRADQPAHALVLPHAAERVRVVGFFGFESVPASIRDAALGWAQRAYHEHRARMSDSVVDPDGGVTSYFRQVPPFVSAAIHAFRVPSL